MTWSRVQSVSIHLERTLYLLEVLLIVFYDVPLGFCLDYHSLHLLYAYLIASSDSWDIIYSKRNCDLNQCVLFDEILGFLIS